ncbi:N-6 DNA methylase [Christensenellaceae bacterium NSJ-63]|uniref:site-specific DNA-methyltransferase (adenine-specific) n=1 Tax=Guopingia tenuis TaxID=2763656 RepID=A0A926HRG9_9FIRM|nr:TaqI-like C-terminal specificity domain-containing protein [Guopingia tenuis]MBC8537392.1 N-6 DNA methylase [Guopingia tenuis]
MYISVSDAAEKFNISKRRVQLLCEQGRIEGANMVSGVWLIPSEAQKPTDARKKKLTPINQMSLFDVFENMNTEKLSLDQVCEILSISSATAKNWIRLGKLSVGKDGKSFEKAYIENLALEIKSGKDKRLKSRRNKKSVSGNVLYQDYVENEGNRDVVKNILETCSSISEEELRVIIAFFSVQLYCQSRGIAAANNNFPKLKTASNNCVFNALIVDLIGDIDLDHFDYTNIQFIAKLKISFIPQEDTLGFIYISLRDLSLRKQTGAYYTPARTVTKLIDYLFADGINFENRTFCDPCCGTGNFLICLLNKGVNVANLYGQDIDELSVLITRINIFLLNGNLSKEHLESHFICGNTLENTFVQSFSVVLGNPPWGYNFSKEEISFLLKHYKTGKSKGIESYDLFIERSINLLEKNGCMAYVLPEAILSVASHLQARELILENTSFKFVSYLGNAFAGVQCPAIILGVQKDRKGNTEQCKVQFDNMEFRIGKNRNFDASLFSFNMNDDQYDCLKAIENISNAKYLANNANFALGIVTGNNKEYIKNNKENGYEVVLKGSDILRYAIKDSNNYIRFEPELFQQVAPTELYRAKEKLLYRFICEVPVFTYDNKQTLSLNSCNILIPQIEGMSIKYVLAVLNSSVASYFLSKKFNSVKLLKSHIESLPIPMAGKKFQKEIEKKVDQIMDESESDTTFLYNELDNDIFSVYCLSLEQRDTIKKALCDKTTFLK